MILIQNIDSLRYVRLQMEDLIQRKECQTIARMFEITFRINFDVGAKVHNIM